MKTKIAIALTLILGGTLLGKNAFSDPKSLSERKAYLNKDIEHKMGKCKCLVDLIDHKERYFPESREGRGALTKQEYIAAITDFKVATGRAQTALKEMVSNWPEEKNSPKDINNLDVKVSTEIQARVSYCIQPFWAIHEAIQDLSKGKEKIDARKCGVNPLQPQKKPSLVDRVKGIFKR